MQQIPPSGCGLDAYLKAHRISYTQFGRDVGLKGKNPGRTIERIAKGQARPSFELAAEIVSKTNGIVSFDALWSTAPKVDADAPAFASAAA